jgi:S1-C subfamily serine protease
MTLNSTSVLEQYSQQRAALAATLTPRAIAIPLGRHRSVSGFHWRDDYLVTAAEALAGSEQLLTVSEHGERGATVLACDLATDVAVLRVSGEQAAVGARDSGTTGSGQSATAAAAHHGPAAGAGVVIVGRGRHGPLVGFGEVRLSGPAWRSRRGGAIAQRLEFAAVLDERFEGALVADFAGVVLAMLVAGPRGRLLGIPAATIERIVATVERHGSLPRPYLGLRLQPLWLDEATRARWGRRGRRIALVAGVEQASPAAAAGLAPGDLLEAINGVAIEDVDEFVAQLGESGPGSPLELQLRRGGALQSVQLTVGQRPTSRG